MKRGRVQHVIRTLAEIRGGYRSLGGPLGRELLVLCPGRIEVDLITGEVRAGLHHPEIVYRLTSPFIYFVQNEIKRDKGPPPLARAKMIFSLGTVAEYCAISRFHYGFEVKRDSAGTARQSYKVGTQTERGSEYEIVMSGFVEHAGRQHEFSHRSSMRIRDDRISSTSPPNHGQPPPRYPALQRFARRIACYMSSFGR